MIFFPFLFSSTFSSSFPYVCLENFTKGFSPFYSILGYSFLPASLREIHALTTYQVPGLYEHKETGIHITHTLTHAKEYFPQRTIPFLFTYTFSSSFPHVNRDIGPAVRVFANGPGDLGSIPGRVIPKTLKMVLDTTLLNTQHYKVRFKGKVEQSWEWSSALPYTLV